MDDTIQTTRFADLTTDGLRDVFEATDTDRAGPIHDRMEVQTS